MSQPLRPRVPLIKDEATGSSSPNGHGTGEWPEAFPGLSGKAVARGWQTSGWAVPAQAPQLYNSSYRRRVRGEPRQVSTKLSGAHVLYGQPTKTPASGVFLHHGGAR